MANKKATAANAHKGTLNKINTMTTMVHAKTICVSASCFISLRQSRPYQKTNPATKNIKPSIISIEDRSVGLYVTNMPVSGIRKRTVVCNR